MLRVANKRGITVDNSGIIHLTLWRSTTSACLAFEKNIEHVECACTEPAYDNFRTCSVPLYTAKVVHEVIGLLYIFRIIPDDVSCIECGHHD